MSAVTRCKMKVNQVTYTKNQEGLVDSENVQLSAVYSNDPQAENNQWSKWTRILRRFYSGKWKLRLAGGFHRTVAG
jgi:hypothetical protein